MRYLPRSIESTIRRYLKLFPAVIVTGPRQSGKSTTLRAVFGKDYRYVSFDDPIVAEQFERDPRGFMDMYPNRVIFDEAQRSPDLFRYLKMTIDEDRSTYGKFIVTGSSQFALIRGVTETMAGRAGQLSLLPLEMREMPEHLRSEQILRGSYPELVTRRYRGHREWYAAYVDSYLERDVRTLINVGNLRDFRRFLMLAAARTAQELNLSSWAAEIGVSVKTVQSWISILEASYVVFLVPPYHRNLGKRIVKRPKLYFFDTGLVCFLTGLSQGIHLDRGPLAGPIFETYVQAELMKGILHGGLSASLFYFRDNLGLEADGIVVDRERGDTLYIEIKNTSTPTPRMAAALQRLINADQRQSELPPRRIRGVLVHRGPSTERLAPGVDCPNYREFLGDWPHSLRKRR